MKVLNPNLNGHLTSLSPSPSNFGERVHVYDGLHKKLLYSTKDITSLSRVTGTTHGTIKKHLDNPNMLFLSTFFISTKKVHVLDKPTLSENAFKKIALKRSPYKSTRGPFK